MSTDPKYLLEVIRAGEGLALDLGGGSGEMRRPIENLGYVYVNIDIRRYDNVEPSVCGSADALPFRPRSFSMVISKDSLEHLLDPWAAVRDVHRILKPRGLFVIWVPFMHPFHGDDTFRYSPLALQHLLQGFTILRLESPLWGFTVIGTAVTELLRRWRLTGLERPVRGACAWLDRLFTRTSSRPLSFAAAYRVVAERLPDD